MLADTRRAVALFETLLRERWYVPRGDVRMELLAPSDATSTCPYKGHATYFSLASSDDDELTDVAWTYVDPLPEAALVRDHVCFYAELARRAVRAGCSGGSSRRQTGKPRRSAGNRATSVLWPSRIPG